MIWPFHPIRPADAAILLCGTLCFSFCLCGRMDCLLTDDRNPLSARHGFGHGFRQRRFTGQQMCKSGWACPGQLLRYGAEQVGRTSQNMTKMQLHRPGAILFGWRLSHRHGRCIVVFLGNMFEPGGAFTFVVQLRHRKVRKQFVRG